MDTYRGAAGPPDMPRVGDNRPSPRDMAEAVRRVLYNFSCPEIATVSRIPDEPTSIGIEAADGTLFVLEVTEP